MIRLARELDETARQSASMLDGIAAAVALLADPVVAPEKARREAAGMIVQSLQGQDRIEQRCRNLARAVRHFGSGLTAGAARELDDIFGQLDLDELRLPELSGSAGRLPHGDAELF